MKLFASVVSQLSGPAGGDDLFPKYSLPPSQAPPAERRPDRGLHESYIILYRAGFNCSMKLVSHTGVDQGSIHLLYTKPILRSPL